jgi:hypothetical protein
VVVGLDAGDTPDEQLARTWIAAQELRLIYHSPDRARAEQALYRWLNYCADADIPELIRSSTLYTARRRPCPTSRRSRTRRGNSSTMIG